MNKMSEAQPLGDSELLREHQGTNKHPQPQHPMLIRITQPPTAALAKAFAGDPVQEAARTVAGVRYRDSVPPASAFRLPANAVHQGQQAGVAQPPPLTYAQLQEHAASQARMRALLNADRQAVQIEAAKLLQV